MAEIIFLLCAIMSSACAVMLYRGYNKTSNRLLLWSAICFALVAMNNIFLVLDLVVLPEVDLNGPFWRNLLSALAGSSLLGGLIKELS